MICRINENNSFIYNVIIDKLKYYTLLLPWIFLLTSCEIELPIEEDRIMVTNELQRSDTQQDFIQKKLTQRCWLDYSANGYCLNYITYKEDYNSSKNFRKRLRIPYEYQDGSYWGKLYLDLFDADKNKLAYLADTLAYIGEKYNLSRNQFANMVVAFVQDIPYSYILVDEKCMDKNDGFDCVDGQRFGILTPIEFLHTLKGDCDTRTVLLYSIFKYFNFSPKIAISEEYAHSMLLLDVVTSGDYLTYNGKKYYFWETTAEGWKAGLMPPDFSNINNWEIALY